MTLEPGVSSLGDYRVWNKPQGERASTTAFYGHAQRRDGVGPFNLAGDQLGEVLSRHADGLANCLERYPVDARSDRLFQEIHGVLQFPLQSPLSRLPAAQLTPRKHLRQSPPGCR